MDHKTEREWDQLALETGASPFVRPGWYRCWIGAFGEEQNFRVAVLSLGGDVAAVLPVLVSGRSLRGLTNSETPENDAVARGPRAGGDLLRALLDAGYRKLDLDFLPATGSIVCGLRGLGDGRGPALLKWVTRNQAYVETEGDWHSYERHHLSGRRRRDVGRLWRRLADTGSVKFQVDHGLVRLDALLTQGFEVESMGWKGRSGTAIRRMPAAEHFYRSIARWARSRGILRIAFLRLDERPISFCLALEQNGVLYCLKAGYDERYSGFSPGILLLHRLLRYSFEASNIQRLEMLGYDDGYKLAFAHGTKAQLRVQAFRGFCAQSVDRTMISAAYRARLAARAVLSESTRASYVNFADRCRASMHLQKDRQIGRR